MPRLRGRLLDGGDDQARRRRVPRPARGAAAGAGQDQGRRRAPECFVVASESCAFDIIGAKLMREVQPGEMVSLTEGGLEMRQVIEAERRPSACSSTSTSRAPTPGSRAGSCRRSAAGWASCSGRRGAGRRRPGDLGARLGQPGGQRLRARLGAAPGRRADQEPLRRAHLHPARPGAAQARSADEVQPAARDRRRQARRRRRRLDRARQHHPPDRRDAERRGREGGPPADLGAADPPSLPLRHRHVHARGDDRPRPQRGRGRRPSSAPTRSPTSRWRASTRRSGTPARAATATPASPATIRWATPRPRTASSRSRTSRSSRVQARLPARGHVPRRRPRLGHRDQPAGDPRPAPRARRDRGGRAWRRTSRTRWRCERAPKPGSRPRVFPRADHAGPRRARRRDRRLARASGTSAWSCSPATCSCSRPASWSASATGSSTCTRRCCPPFPGSTRSGRRSTTACRVTGVTVHFVDEGVDSGPIILQRPVPVPPSRDRDELEEEIHASSTSCCPRRSG